jgi:hypothetical protein
MSAASYTGYEIPAGARALQNESAQSAVSWAAVFAGAVTATAITVVLVALGTGLGLTSISPWQNQGASAKTFVIATGIGLIVVQWLSSAIGGYITGRLRTKWVGVHTHEVLFRDTAHGLLAWGVATLIGSVFLASAASAVVGGTVDAATSAAGAAGHAAAAIGPNVMPYDVDSLFRSDRPEGANTAGVDAQATHILQSVLTTGDLSQADQTYLAQLIASRTGITQADAQRRVDEVIAREKQAVVKAKQAADAARKASAAVSIFSALSMAIGAFIACVAAAYAGRLRDADQAQLPA